MSNAIRLSLISLALLAGCSGAGGGSTPPPGVASGAAAGGSLGGGTNTGGVNGGNTSSGAGSGTTGTTGWVTPIRHVFVIVKENHTFDNYFGTYAGANGATSGVDSTGATRPLKTPITDLYYAGSNSWDAAHTDYAGGGMTGFDQGEMAPILFLTNGAFVSYSGGAVGYYNTIAGKGVLCDAFFTSVMGPSVPNHLYLLAATSGGAIDNPGLLGGSITVIDAAGNKSAHAPSFSAAEVPTTLPNELEKKGFSWAYYDESSVTNITEGQGEGVKMFAVFKNLASFATNYIDDVADYDVNLASTLATRTVGNVTFIHPAADNSEHPIVGGVGKGVDWTRKVVNQIAQSPYWADCAIFITFDDYGGFYDHVAPPQVDALGLGFRVPCMIVSPYAKTNLVDPTTYEFCSIVRFCETTFGLPTMTTRDAAANDMMSAFDFSAPARPASDFIVP